MTAHRDLDQQLRVHLQDRADRVASDAQLAAILDRTAATRQRPSWLASVRSHLMSTRSIAARPAIPRVAWVVVAAGLLLAVMLAAAFIGAPRKPLPPLNGRIVFGRYDTANNTVTAWTVNPDGTHLQQVLTGDHEAAFWSSDGKSIGFTDGYVDVATSRFIARDFSRPPMTLAAWDQSPDGKLLLMEGFNPTDTTVDASVHGVYTVGAKDGSGLVVLSKPGEAGVPGAFSPDGRMVAFVRPTDVHENGDLMVVNFDGTNEHQLGTITVGGPMAWARDGRSILAASNGTLFSVDLATGAAIPVRIKAAPGAGIWGGVWSPDGTRILFKRDMGGNNLDLFTMRPDGTDVIQVTNERYDDRSFAWGTNPPQ